MEEAVIEDVPVSPLLSRRKENPYGSVEGLPDEELADPAELERQVYREEFGPVLMLPEQQRWSGIRPNIDEDGKVDWGAFATVDFERTQRPFNKRRYKAEKLREELRNTLIMIGIVRERLPRRQMYMVLKQVRMGVLELDDIDNFDMLGVARLYVQARRLQQQIRELGGHGMSRAEIAEVLR